MNGVCQYRSSFFPLGFIILFRDVCALFFHPTLGFKIICYGTHAWLLLKKNMFINICSRMQNIHSHITPMLVVLLIIHITLCTILYNSILLLYYYYCYPWNISLPYRALDVCERILCLVVWIRRTTFLNQF